MSIIHVENNHRKINILAELELFIFITYFYQISREKFEPEPGLELGPPDL